MIPIIVQSLAVILAGLVKRKEESKPAVGIEALHARGALFLT